MPEKKLDLKGGFAPGISISVGSRAQVVMVEPEVPGDEPVMQLHPSAWPVLESRRVTINIVRGASEVDGGFYDGATMKLHEGEPLPPDPGVKITYPRRWRWPIIKEIIGAIPTDYTSLGCNEAECSFSYERMYVWPWHRSMWWWVKGIAKRLWLGPDNGTKVRD